MMSLANTIIINIYIYTYTHTHIYIYIYICVCVYVYIPIIYSHQVFSSKVSIAYGIRVDLPPPRLLSARLPSCCRWPSVGTPAWDPPSIQVARCPQGDDHCEESGDSIGFLGDLGVISWDLMVRIGGLLVI